MTALRSSTRTKLTRDQLVYVLDLHWLTLVTLIKLSILHFYSVVFRGKDTFAKVVYGAMAVVVAYWIGTFWADAFLCNPPRKAVSGISSELSRSEG